MPKVFIIFYSLYHHVYTLAQNVQKGLESQGVQVELYQVPETLDDAILEKMHAPAKPDVPVITVDKLQEADGFLFGLPTRFGIFPAQLKAFLDSTGGLWSNGTLAGKFAGTFFSTASQHGGQETTALTAVTYFAHHGINYVPFGFAHAHLFSNDEVIGGSAYGAGTVANGDGSRQPSEKELEIAQAQGENFGKLLVTFEKGSNASAENGDAIKTEQQNGAAKQSEEEEEAPAAAAATTTSAPAAKREAAPKKEEDKKNKCFCM
ncbi:flavoprotein-like protein [Zychaea mexicana]|uniref:flavoprotein-like protein n=1 Tax=Zychaea mexicana TaxID=64656 RepID=UPI0022FF130F|nr:flavoprotein-like protein [Zychaea mexicana]KAI9489319.1 flavoprotein-like protein [Zychaea mexicana]